jgi:tRNA(Ile)-lysidine synthase TilS/MesJ
MVIRCDHLLNVTLCFVNVINQSENNQIYRIALSGGADSNCLLLAGRQAYKHYTSTAYRG